MTALVTITAVAAGAVVLNRLDAGIQTFNAAGLGKHRPPPTVAGTNILLLGSDTRTGADAKLGGKGDNVGRSDTTVLVHVYEGGTRAVGVSIPRDALVDIPSCLLPDGSWSAPQHDVMFNSAYMTGQSPKGNPACTIRTVEKLTGLRVDHTVIADFAGFAQMTQVVGGVQVCLPDPIYQGDLDPNRPDRGRLIFHAGKQMVSGAKALAYVRIRHGIGDGSDIGRMKRQQAFLSAVISKVRNQGLTPTKILPLAEAATRNFTVDPSLDTAAKLAKFVISMRNMTPSNISFVTAPWRYEGARVALVHPDVDRLWAALKADQPINGAATKKPGPKLTVAQALAKVKVPVTVLNGTTVTGLASRTGAKLKHAGMTVGGVGNTTARSTTAVEYGPGDLPSARMLAAAFPGSTLEQSTTPGLRLLVGTEHTMRSGTARAVAPKVALPASVTNEARTANQDSCSGVSYG
ncbi:MAG: LCP family protein [Nocardioidaceae bacterium]